MAKKITMEQLAEMMAHGLNDVETRLGEKIDKEVGAVREVTSEILNEVKEMRKELHLPKRVQRLEADVEVLERVSKLEDRVAHLERRDTAGVSA